MQQCSLLTVFSVFTRLAVSSSNCRVNAPAKAQNAWQGCLPLFDDSAIRRRSTITCSRSGLFSCHGLADADRSDISNDCHAFMNPGSVNRSGDDVRFTAVLRTPPLPAPFGQAAEPASTQPTARCFVRATHEAWPGSAKLPAAVRATSYVELLSPSRTAGCWSRSTTVPQNHNDYVAARIHPSREYLVSCSGFALLLLLFTSSPPRTVVTCRAGSVMAFLAWKGLTARSLRLLVQKLPHIKRSTGNVPIFFLLVTC